MTKLDIFLVILELICTKCIQELLLNAYTVKSTICTQLIHNDSSQFMPDSFEDPLRIFGRLFTTRLDSTNLHSRQKRGGSSFNNFLTWITGDTPQRIYNIETVEMTHLHKINKLIDQSQETSLSIDQNSKELAVIYDDLKNDEIQIKDINLKVDLMKVFHHCTALICIILEDCQISKLLILPCY